MNEASSAKVRGYVRSRTTGRGLVGATVSAGARDTDSVVSVRTVVGRGAPEGFFELELRNVSGGVYWVRAEKAGYVDSMQSIDIEAPGDYGMSFCLF